MALYMQAACRRQPLKRDLCCSTCTIFHLDSVIGHVLLFFTCSYLSSRHSASRVREVERSVFYSLPSLFYARCLQPPQSVRTLKCWCASASWSKHLGTLHVQTTTPSNVDIGGIHPPASSPRPTSHALSPLTATTGKDIRYTNQDHRARVLEKGCGPLNC